MVMTIRILMMGISDAEEKMRTEEKGVNGWSLYRAVNKLRTVLSVLCTVHTSHGCTVHSAHHTPSKNQQNYGGLACRLISRPH